MGATLEVINALLALFSIADKFGVNIMAVNAAYAKARAEGRDVTKDEVQAMSDQAAKSGAALQDIINQLPK